jgi:hypothetical protein
MILTLNDLNGRVITSTGRDAKWAIMSGANSHKVLWMCMYGNVVSYAPIATESIMPGRRVSLMKGRW